MGRFLKDGGIVNSDHFCLSKRGNAEQENRSGRLWYAIYKDVRVVQVYAGYQTFSKMTVDLLLATEIRKINEAINTRSTHVSLRKNGFINVQENADFFMRREISLKHSKDTFVKHQ